MIHINISKVYIIYYTIYIYNIGIEIKQAASAFYTITLKTNSIILTHPIIFPLQLVNLKRFLFKSVFGGERIILRFRGLLQMFEFGSQLKLRHAALKATCFPKKNCRGRRKLYPYPIAA